MRNGIRGALFVGLLLALAGVASAQGVAQSRYFNGDIAAFHGKPDSLINAIHKVENVTGGRVIEIRFAEKDGMPGYHIAMVKGGKITFIRLDEQSGKVLQIDEASTPVWMLNWRGKADVHFAETAKVPLSQAILTAEQANNNAPAIAAGIARSASNPNSAVHAYNVLIDADGTPRRFAIDDSNGGVIADPGALSGWP
jgi:uncharacterized membrane protein YkoI